MKKFGEAVAIALLVTMAGIAIGISNPIFWVLAAVFIIGYAWIIYPGICYWTAIYKYGKKNYFKAIKWFDRAEKTNRMKAPHMVNYAYYLLRLGYAEKSETLLNKLTAKENIPVQIKNSASSNLAILYAKTGRLAQAAELMENLFAKFKNTNTYGIYGYFLLLQDRAEEALKINLEAYEYAPSNAVIRDNLGLNYYKLGRYEEAEKIYDLLMEDAPNFIEAYYDAALVKVALCKTSEAKSLLETAKTKECSFLSWVNYEDIEAELNKLS